MWREQTGSWEGFAEDVRKKLVQGLPVEGVSVHRSLSVLQLPQVEETLSEPRVGPVQTGAPDGLTEKTNVQTGIHELPNNQKTNSKTLKTCTNASGNHPQEPLLFILEIRD